MEMLPDGDNKLALQLLLGPQVYGRPFGAPAGVPADRLDTLRKAFLQTLQDRSFLADADKAQLEIRYTSPDHIESAIHGAFNTPQAVRDQAIDVLQKASSAH
jgi:tripartite-type tricarboxylate transporter receptor subunit TctC